MRGNLPLAAVGERTQIRVHALVDSLTYGGAELLLSEFAAVAPAAGIDFSVGYLQERADNPGVERLQANGVEPMLVGIPPHLFHPAAFLRVRRHLAAIKPDIVHTHLGDADLLGGTAARSLGLPVLSTVHAIGSLQSLRQSRRGRVLARLIALAR